jgi:cbb3-type cytochrome oxidase subunit 3
MTLFVEQGYWGAALGVLLFLAIFLGAVAWMYRPGAAKGYARSAAMPLHDGSMHDGSVRDRTVSPGKRA